MTVWTSGMDSKVGVSVDTGGYGYCTRRGRAVCTRAARLDVRGPKGS